MTPHCRWIAAGAAWLAVGLLAGCIDGYAPSPGEQSRGQLSQAAVHSYLARAELARPEIVQAVTLALRQGRSFRKRIRDQRNKWCLTTVWIDRRNTLHVVTRRNETCPKCKGTGKRQWSKSVMERLPFDTRCLECDGKGHLENHTIERKYTLSPMDYENPADARETIDQNAFRNAPAGTEAYVGQLASKDPQKRLDACLWLDRHYVREGQFFQDILPMLKKARQRDQDEETMVWQWWAGRGLESEKHRAYYRVYAHTKNGKVYRKGFYPAQ